MTNTVIARADKAVRNAIANSDQTHLSLFAAPVGLKLMMARSI